MDSFKDYKDGIITNALWDLIKKVLSFLLFTIISSSIFKSIFEKLTSQISDLNSNSLFFTIVFALFFMLVLVTIYQRYFTNRPIYPPLPFDYKILSKEVTYHYISKSNIVYTKKITLKAQKNGLDRYEDRYHWSSNGKVTPSCVTNGHGFVNTKQMYGFQYYDIFFNKTLNKGETHTFEIKMDLDDTNSSAMPYLASTTEEPTGLLKLEVCFPKEFGINEITREVCFCLGSKRKISSVNKGVDVHGNMTVHIWEVKNPKLLHNYAINWFFKY